MRRIKYYSNTDLSSGFMLDEMERRIAQGEFISSVDVNSILEAYNILLFIENEASLKRWTEEYRKNLISLQPYIQRELGIFFSNIKDHNFESTASLVDRIYIPDFLELFEKYNLPTRISNDSIDAVLTNKVIHLSYILKQQTIVDSYGETVKYHIMNEEENLEIILEKYFIKKDEFINRKNIYLPSNLKTEDINELILKYLHSDNINSNFLKLIETARVIDKLNIPDKIKLKAKRKREHLEAKYFKNSFGGMKIEYIIKLHRNLQLEKTEKFANDQAIIKYSLDWLEDNLDYPTILQNFIWLFNYTDFCGRISLVSYPNDLSVLERILGLSSKYEYKTGVSFSAKESISSMNMIMYYDFLKNKGIRLEEVIEWFFKEYLKHEFGVDDYSIKLPSKKSTYQEKCKVIAPEIESVLKQFNVYIEDRKIDRELIEISSTPITFGTVGSLLKNKYLYTDDEVLNNLMHHLFSDQSPLAYIASREISEDNFYSIITKHRVQLKEIEDHKYPLITHLIESEVIYIDTNNFIRIMNNALLDILYQLNKFETINYYRSSLLLNNNKLVQQKLDTLLKEGRLKTGSNLFSREEVNYFNYYLNNSEFTNGPALRNKYAHGRHSTEPEENRMDYMIFMKIIILILLKINDEFILQDILNGAEC